ncbi:hypothetical protein [uncultured Rikenella sp.]|uniref:hypothetical protein n=1 Tax=uncultured Rikenella sp. TaxID=368003 RepID=UPI0025F34675|nr:hypothetical protein [uncultured Rikenella sp.]
MKQNNKIHFQKLIQDLKKHLKTAIFGSVALAAGVSAWVNFRLASSEQPLSDLTLANIEAMSYIYDNNGSKYGECNPPWELLCVPEVFNNGYPGKPADNSGGPYVIEFPGIFKSLK